ncbi:hypothetical protein IFM89_023241 [Coptis chinensis]|uniref:Uncharacterized protein n=1 Tax=Coptis chinensis TaxID=261450 RepID=A0A835M1F8_9MAGN|nr:hypothetical protein IFM89_023241 [Coptis chinensis]
MPDSRAKRFEERKRNKADTRTVAHIQKPLLDPPFVKINGRPKDFTSFLDKGKNGTRKGNKKSTQAKPNAKKNKTQGKEISNGEATERDSDFHTFSQDLIIDTEQQSRYSHDLMLPYFNQGSFEHIFLRPQQPHGIVSIDLNRFIVVTL